jgi:hypothetical protein
LRTSETMEAFPCRDRYAAPAAGCIIVAQQPDGVMGDLILYHQ